MDRRERQRQSDFFQALGECFAECVCPPVPWDDLTIADGWDIACRALDGKVTPTRLAALTPADVRRLGAAFAERFDTAAPSARQIRAAVAAALARWPVGSLGEPAEPGAAADGGT